MNSDINKPKTENSAGVVSLKFADINNVESVENGILKMKTGFTVKKIDVTTGKWSFEGDLSPDANGVYDFKLSGAISGHDSTILKNSMLASATDLILLIYLNNITYLAGNTEEGIHFKFGHLSGLIPGDETGYKLDFYRKLRKPVVVLNQII